jgi:hypothetical protein
MVTNFMSSVFELISPGMADHITDQDHGGEARRIHRQKSD